MNARPLAAVIICFATGCALGAGVDLQLRTSKARQLVFEPADLRVVLVNRGRESVSVAPAIGSSAQVRIERPDGWINCRTSLSITPGVGSIQWRRLAPGEEMELSLLPFTCPGVGETFGPSFTDWTEVPGRYRLQVESTLVTPTESGAAAAPPDALGGLLTSNPVTIEVSAAQGVDAEALKWASENQHNPLDVAVANRFPTSTYSAIVLWKYVSPALPEPAKVKAALANGAFPQERAVPDPAAPDGWATRAGKELAQWQIETGERILGQHPGFLYERPMRLSIALAYLATGKAERGSTELRVLGKDVASPEGRWAEKYLAIKD